MVPAAEELAPSAAIQLEETLVMKCNNTVGLRRVILPLTKERVRLSAEMKQPAGRIIQ